MAADSVAAYASGPYGSAVGALLEPKNLPAVRPFGKSCRAVHPHDFKSLADNAVDALLSEFRHRCKESAQEQTTAAEFARLLSFIAALQRKFEIAVVTVNYDNILYRTLPGIETGFDPQTKRFNEKRIFERRVWPCMLHLHGSVHFDMPTTSNSDMHEIFWEPDINADFAQNAAGRGGSLLFKREGLVLPTSAIIAGYAKTMQILRRPFRTYYSELDRLVSECDALLLAGYGFGDDHLNIAFEQFREDSRHRPVAFIQKTARGEAPWGHPNFHGPIADAIQKTFRTNLEPMYSSVRTNVIRALNRLIDEREFARSTDPPLAIWHNGMLEACDYPDKVIAVLNGS